MLGAYWCDSPSDLDESEQGEGISIVAMEEAQVFESLLDLMEETDDNKDKPVILLDIKKNLKDYHLNKMRSLSSILIDSLNELAKDKENLKKNLDKCEEKVIKLSVQVTELTSEKRKLKDDLSKHG